MEQGAVKRPSPRPSHPTAHTPAANTLLYLQPPIEGVDWGWIPSVREGCLLPAAVLRLARGSWARLLWSPWLHLDDMHLYYNMASLLFKASGWCRKWCGSSGRVLV